MLRHFGLLEAFCARRGDGGACRLFCNNCGMTQGRKKRRRRILLVKSRKRLSMEEKSPTMPSVVFLKYLKITGEGTDSQGKFDYAVCDASCKIKCDTGKPQWSPKVPKLP